MKGRIEASHLRHRGQPAVERLDQSDLAGEMSRIERHGALQFGDDRGGDLLVLDEVRSAVDDPMPDADESIRRERLVQQLDQPLGRLGMIGRRHLAPLGLLTVTAGNDQQRPRLPDPLDLAAQRPPQWRAVCIGKCEQREFDARRTAIDRQNLTFGARGRRRRFIHPRNVNKIARSCE